MAVKVHLYCDAEFNGFGGELISMALYEPITGNQFYAEKLLNHGMIEPWVMENVVPKLVFGNSLYSDKDFREALWRWLQQHWGNRKIVVVADWPEDLAHFASHMCKDNGVRCGIQFEMKLIKSEHEQTTDPHFAPSDAYDLAIWAHANKDKWDI